MGPLGWAFLIVIFFGSLHTRSYMYMNPKPMFDFIQIQSHLK